MFKGKCKLLGLKSFKMKNEKMANILTVYFEENSSTCELFVSPDMDINKIMNIHKLQDMNVTIKMEGKYISVIDVESVKK